MSLSWSNSSVWFIFSCNKSFNAFWYNYCCNCVLYSIRKYVFKFEFVFVIWISLFVFIGSSTMNFDLRSINSGIPLKWCHIDRYSHNCCNCCLVYKRVLYKLGNFVMLGHLISLHHNLKFVIPNICLLSFVIIEIQMYF